MEQWKQLLAIYAAMSAVAFAVFAVDKRAAMRGQRRVRERTLHILSLLCGWPGSMAAMTLVRHKRRKAGFVAITWAIAALHIALWAAWIAWADQLIR